MRTLGSLTLCRSLLEAGLVDRFRVVVFPVITGRTGSDRIYDGYPDVALEMVASRTFDGRIQLLEYVPTVLSGPPADTGLTPGTRGARAMSLARVQFFSVSLDGFGTGEGLSLDAPFGHAGDRLHEWMFATRWWHEMVGEAGGSGGIDDAFLRLHGPGVGAEIMGAGKFGYPGWHEDPEWKGWWGPNPPFHTPVFVLTHHTRPPIEMEGGTTFHFVDATPAEALGRPARPRTAVTSASAAAPARSGSSWRPGSSTTCTWSWSRSCSAGACGCGTGWRASRTATRSRPPLRPAASST